MKPRYAFALALLLCLAWPLGGATSGPPDAPAGRRIRALLQAFEVGTPEAMKAFVSRGAAGGTLGVNAALEMDLDTGYTVVVLSNLDPPSAEKVSRTLRPWLGLR